MEESQRLGRAAAFAAMVVLAGCGDTHPELNDAGSSPHEVIGARDSAAPSDARAQPDGAAPSDAGAQSDARAQSDAAPPRDAGAQSDAAPMPDAGPCAAQDARPVARQLESPSEIWLWQWTGENCFPRRFEADIAEVANQPNVMLTSLGCEGADCAALSEYAPDCVRHYESCGARVENPLRGSSFSGRHQAGVMCGWDQGIGPTPCPSGEECAFIVTESCQPPASEDPYRLRCDDPLDCSGAHCCVGTLNWHLVSSCRAACDLESEGVGCLGDKDCAADQHCCSAVTPQPSAGGVPPPNTIGVCTAHPCAPWP